MKLVQQREALRHKVMSKFLQEYPDRNFRPVTVYPNFDKLSGAWLLALPGSSTGLSSPVFVEALAAHLCLPSPTVQESGWVGRPLGRRGVGGVVDKYGDSIMNCLGYKWLPSRIEICQCWSQLVSTWSTRERNRQESWRPTV